MIKNGKPYTCEHDNDDYKLLSDALPERQEQVLEWIDEFVSPSKYTNKKHSSYSMKHRFARWICGNEKISNNQFKDAMMIKGYMPVNPNEINWYYKIKVAEIYLDEWALLQRKLLPDQNEVLKNFVISNFPDMEVEKVRGKSGAYRYFGVSMEWYMCRNKNQAVITVWPYHYNDFFEKHYKDRKTIRLVFLKEVNNGRD